MLNIESSHCYNDIEKFYSECARVIKPDGTFFYSDLIWDIPLLNDNYKLMQKYFNVVSFTDITQNVLQSCIEISHVLEPYANIPEYRYMHNIDVEKQNTYKSDHYFIIMKLTPKV